MADVPPEMMTGERQPDPAFADDEILYRRFRPDDFDGGEVAPEAFELPDMSANRGKYGPPEWLLLGEGFAGWGVGAFQVSDVPCDREQLHLGVIVYLLQAEHVPHRHNYPHSEVRVYREHVRICRENHNLEFLDPDFHLRWRERLSQCSWAAIPPRAAE
jgi:hypothetical protein